MFCWKSKSWNDYNWKKRKVSAEKDRAVMADDKNV